MNFSSRDKISGKKTQLKEGKVYVLVHSLGVQTIMMGKANTRYVRWSHDIHSQEAESHECYAWIIFYLFAPDPRLWNGIANLGESFYLSQRNLDTPSQACSAACALGGFRAHRVDDSYGPS